MTRAPAGGVSAPFAGLRERLQQVGDFFLRQRHLAAVRDGVMGALPLVLVGSVFLLIAQPPSRALQEWIAPWTPVLLVPYRMLGGLIAVYVAFSAAYSLAKSYQLDPMASGLLAMAAYLIAAFPTPPLAGVVVDAAAVPAPMIPALPLQRLGAGGIFAALLLAIVAVEITRVFVRRQWTIRLPPTAPEVIVRAFVALIPAFAVITLTFVAVHLVGFDLVHALEQLARPFLVVTGSLPAALGVVAVDSALWLLGVHATAALATLKPLWESMLIQNMEAAVAGQSVLPHIASQQFYLWFVWQGGSGMTLALALHLLRARSSQLRGVGRVALIPALCNINEPVIFGVPIVLNPRLVVPFFAAPLLAAITAYLAFHLHLVNRPFLETLWTLPAPIGAFLATGGDWRAIA
ncbi:MAG TPA: PTS transporter subunit EIIC, partial [Myxococcaceae bacterium]|nr:PTS transporter subunit EIIC [Myxococcaceae bacterium]